MELNDNYLREGYDERASGIGGHVDFAWEAALLGHRLSLAGCTSSKGPDPIKVLENPETGERARFFREITFKVPMNYDETKHLAEWSAEQVEAGFTKEISPIEDRKILVEIRRKNLAANHR